MMVPRARPRVVLLTLFAVAVPVHAGQNPVFDVASVRRAPSAPFSFPGLMLQPSGRATSPGSSVRQLILTAYGLDDLQLIGGPAWIASDLYAIEARTVEGATSANVRLMLRALLQERFQLAVHSETRDLPASAIGVGRRCSPRCRTIGLKLDSRRLVVDVLVIDRIERPTEN